ncbi:hypothetical protein Tco_0042082, partial [Tanacetum coccineum]
VGRPKKKRKRSKHEDEPFVKDGGNNAEASSSTSGHAQQVEPVVGQDSSGGSSVGVVIGLFVVGAQPARACVGVGSQSSSPTKWTKRRVQTQRLGLQKTTHAQLASQPSTHSQVQVTEIRNANGREIGVGIPIQSSAAGGAGE